MVSFCISSSHEHIPVFLVFLVLWSLSALPMVLVRLSHFSTMDRSNSIASSTLAFDPGGQCLPLVGESCKSHLHFSTNMAATAIHSLGNSSSASIFCLADPFELILWWKTPLCSAPSWCLRLAAVHTLLSALGAHTRCLPPTQPSPPTPLIRSAPPNANTHSRLERNMDGQ